MKMNKLPIILMFILPVAKADCWSYAEQQFGVESKLLAAIAQVESGMKPEAKGINKNGSIDYGLMQINSMHLPRLQRIGIDKEMLRKDPCVSVLVGASLLSEMMNIYGYSWEAVGAYNAGIGKERHKLRMKYANKVWQVYNRIEITDNQPKMTGS